MAVKRVKAHGRTTTKGKRPVRAYVAQVEPSYKPQKPTLRLEGSEARALLKAGANVGSPVSCKISGYVKEAEAKEEQPKYGPQHSMSIEVKRIEKAKGGKKAAKED